MVSTRLQPVDVPDSLAYFTSNQAAGKVRSFAISQPFIRPPISISPLCSSISDSAQNRSSRAERNRQSIRRTEEAITQLKPEAAYEGIVLDKSPAARVGNQRIAGRNGDGRSHIGKRHRRARTEDLNQTIGILRDILNGDSHESHRTSYAGFREQILVPVKEAALTFNITP